MAVQTTGWTYPAAHGSPVALLARSATANAATFIAGSHGEGVGRIASRLLEPPRSPAA
ncbi:MAG: hypothetical protein QOE59_1411 [Actinomycetota bacterium]|nr:hypothetical protein [Actinomycetota bacterium]